MLREGMPVAGAVTFNFDFIAAVFGPVSPPANSTGTSVGSSAYPAGDKIYAEVPHESTHGDPGTRDTLVTAAQR